MRICEYENVRCPYCGEDEKLKEDQKTITKEGILLHHIHCLSCRGEFYIPCED